MEPMDTSPRTPMASSTNKTADPQAGWDRSETAADDGSAGRVEPPAENAESPKRLTLIRIAIIPFIIVLFSFPESPFMSFLAALTFSVAAFTDYLDGFMHTRQGKVDLMGKALVRIPKADLLLLAFVVLSRRTAGCSYLDSIHDHRTRTGGRRLAQCDRRQGMDLSAWRLGKLKPVFDCRHHPPHDPLPRCWALIPRASGSFCCGWLSVHNDQVQIIRQI